MFEFQSGVWTQVGIDIYGEATDDQFGFAVAMSADGLSVAIGGKTNDGAANNAGHVRVYQIDRSNILYF